MERLRRSFLYAAPMHPASLDMARVARADVVCLDLEDSTPPALKAEARQAIARFLGEGRPPALEVLVRVNAIDTEFCEADLEFAAGLPIDGVLVPKVEEAETVVRVRARLDAKGGRAIAIWCLIETPRGVLRAESIASAGIEGVVIGGADLTEGLGARDIPGREPLLHALSQVVLVARACGITAIDAVHLRFDDPAGYEAACRQASDMGFHGKSLFSADQMTLAHRLFAPSEADVAHARNVLDGGGGYGGHGDHARWIVERHAQVSARDAG